MSDFIYYCRVALVNGQYTPLMVGILFQYLKINNICIAESVYVVKVQI
jgi:hypothetical protein